MVIKSQEALHDEDWKNIKPDYAALAKDKDISARMDLLISFFKKVKPGAILDIGCGSGYFGHLIKRSFPQTKITGCDISEQALAQAKSYDKTYVLNIDDSDIPEDNDSFELVVCADVIEHIYDVDHCLVEIKRVLKPRGKAIITTPNFSFWRYRIKCLFGRMPKILRDPRHIHAFTHDFFARMCYNIGLGVSFTVNQRDQRLVKVFESLFNKTIVAVLTKENDE